jgi:hypothetical protein
LPFSLILNTIAIDIRILTTVEAPMEPDAPAQFFDIEVRVLNPVSGEYPIEITLEDGTVARGSAPLDVLRWESSADTQKDGQRLFNMLLGAGRLREAWGATRSKQRRIRLRIDPPELHVLPWEILHDGQDMLAASASTPFSRYLPIDLSWGQPVAGRSIRVLAVVSNPYDLQTKYDLAAADVEVERHVLQEVLSGKGIALEFLDSPASLRRLEEKLRDGYQVLHLVAHGAFNSKRQQSALYLQDEDGAAQRVIDDDFVAMLSRLQYKPTLIVLATCQSATRSAHDEFIGLGPKLVQAGTPAVVAMQDFVSMATARQFSATLYAQLLKHAMIDLAVNQARSTLLTTGRPDAAVPVLFMRLKDGLLWKLPDQPPAARSNVMLAASASTSTDAIDATDLVALRRLIVTRYNLEEIRTLCSDIGVDYDNLGGEGKEAKARELIAYLKRRNKLNDLIRYLQEDRRT